MGSRLKIFVLISLFLLFLSPLTSFAEESVASKKYFSNTTSSSTEHSENTSLIGKAVPKSSELIQKGAKGLIYCLALLLLAYALKKKKNFQPKKGESDLIQLITRKHLGQRSSLLLIEVSGKKLLLAQNADSISLVSELDQFNFETEEHFSEEQFEPKLAKAINE